MASKILITGCCGLIGRELFRQLKDKKYNVVGVDDFSRASMSCDDPEIFNTSVSNFLENTDKKFDVIFHLAAINGTNNFYDVSNKVLEKNIQTDLAVFKFVENNHDTKLIYASSSEIVSGTENIPTPEITSITFDDIHNPRWSYRISKLVGENYLTNSDIDFLIVRFYNVFSEHSGSGHFVRDIVQKIKNKNFELIGPNETRSFCYVKDAVDALIHVYDKLNKSVINIGSTEELKISQAADIVAGIFGYNNLEWIHVNSRQGSAVRRCPDITKLLQIYPGFKPKKFVDTIREIKKFL